MLAFEFAKKRDQGLRILCLGAHSDDIEIGCGGTILRLLGEYRNVEVRWIVFGSRDARAREAINSADRFLAAAQKKEILVRDFQDGFFPYFGGEVKRFFEDVKTMMSPDIIFTHYRHDLHQDHRIISELTWNTYRDHLILEYEIFKYDGDFGVPNFYVPLDEEVCERKVGVIMECFKSQSNKHWFTADAFFSAMRLRGIEARCPGRFAEGFYCRKSVL